MLSAGSRVAHYDVLASLGAGAMGEVYRAHDVRIKRDVALKVLPSLLAADPDRIRRFEQEAMAAGMLNHPNVLVVFEAGVHEGMPYIVSELLEGATLREHLSRRIPARRSADIALQIANGLSAAHEKNIVHRDLKPENVFILNDGRVKVLDFGLAKLLQPQSEEEDDATRPHGTSPGMVVGTAGYMSPEQVRGEAVDYRSDIFSLGVMLHEMLGGAQPFRRQSSVETMNAILHDDPATLPAETASGLARISQHALEKKPANRFQSAKDFAFAIEALSDSGSQSVVSAKPVAAELKHPSFRRMTFRRGFIMSARFAPDGSVVYGAAWEDNPLEILSSYQTGPEARPLGLRDADVLSVSSSGELAISLNRRFIGVGYATSGTLARVPLAGGAPRRVCHDVQEAVWTRDGKNFLIIRRFEGNYRIESPIGNVIYSSPRWLTFARFSPNEELIGFIDHPLWGDDSGSVVIIDRKGKEVARGQQQFNSTSGMAWTPDGREVWFTGEVIGIGRGRDIQSLSVDGTERVVLPVPGRLTLHDIAADGRVLLAIENGRREQVVGRLGETMERNLSWFDWSRLTAVSRDGSFVVFEEQASGVQGVNTVFIRPTDGAPAVRVMEGRARGNPISADGEWLVICAGSPPHLELVATGVGEPRVIPCDLAEYLAWQFFPDGKSLAVLGNRADETRRLYQVSIDGDTPPRALTTDLPLGSGLAVSHDGRTIAAVGGDARILLVPADGGEVKPLTGALTGDVPLDWTDDDKAIFVSERGQYMLKIYRIDVATGERSEWMTVRPDDPAGILDIMPVHLTPDGKTYAYGYRRQLSDLYIVTGLA